MGQIPIQKYCQTMQTNEQLLSAIENYLAQTEFPAEPELLYAPIGYSLSGGGKRLRPMLLTLACGIFSDDVQHAELTLSLIHI